MVNFTGAGLGAFAEENRLLGDQRIQRKLTSLKETQLRQKTQTTVRENINALVAAAAGVAERAAETGRDATASIAPLRERVGLTAEAGGLDPGEFLSMFDASTTGFAGPTERGLATGSEAAAELTGKLGRLPTGAERTRGAGVEANIQTVKFRDSSGNLVTATFDPGTGEVGAEIGRGPSVQFQPQTLPKSALGDFANAEVSTRVALGELDRVQEQINTEDTFSGAIGTLATSLAGAIGAVKQTAALFGSNDDPLFEAEYDFSEFTGAGAATAAFRSNILNLAYLLARSAEPGGRLSDRDVQNQINRLAATSGSKESINAAMEEVRRGVKQAFRIRHEVISRFQDVGELPADFQEETKSGGISATSHPEGTMATGPNGEKMIVKGGKWVPLKGN